MIITKTLFTVIKKRIKIIKNLVYLDLQKMEERIGMEGRYSKRVTLNVTV